MKNKNKVDFQMDRFIIGKMPIISSQTGEMIDWQTVISDIKTEKTYSNYVEICKLMNELVNKDYCQIVYALEKENKKLKDENIKLKEQLQGGF